MGVMTKGSRKRWTPAQLRELRSELGRKLGEEKAISQTRAAALLKITRRTWAGWEMGVTPTPVMRLLLDALDQGKLKDLLEE